LVRCCCAQSEKAGRTEAELASKLRMEMVEFLDMADVPRFNPREAIKRLRSVRRR
jgi:hypothetical protein